MSDPRPNLKRRRHFGVSTVPVITSVAPSSDLVTGGASVTITGRNFISPDMAAVTVRFGGILATSIVVVSDTSITCNTPAQTEPAVVDLIVTRGTQVSEPFAFIYYQPTIVSLSPAYGPIAGGTEVTISGFNFNRALVYSVKFGTSAATAVGIFDEQTIFATTPNHAVGYVDVILLVGAVEHARLRNGFQFTLLTRGEDIRRQPGITIRDVLNNVPNTATFAVDGTSNIPLLGEKIEITDSFDADRLLFAGNVQNVSQRYEGLTDQLVWDVSCTDFTALLNKYRPFGVYRNMSVTAIVKDLMAGFAPTGFTSNHVQTNLAKISITFDGQKDFSACLNELATAIGGGHWYLDYDEDLHFFHQLPTSIIIPQTSGPITAMVASEGALIPSTFTFPAGYYMFRSTNVFNNGVESALGPLSNCVALQGSKLISLASIPIGAAVGTHTVAKRRIYYQYIGPGVATALARFCEINNNTTVAFTAQFGATGASDVDVLALAVTTPFPIIPRAISPAATAGSPTAFQGSTAVTLPPNPPFTTGVGTSYTAGRWAFKVSNLYRDGSESLPSDASASVTLDGALTATLLNIPIGAAVGTLDVIARKVYASFGASSTRSLSDVVALLNASKARGTIDADWGGIIGHGDSAYLQTVAIPTTYYDLAMIIGFGDLDAMMTVYTDPTWSPDTTAMWALINDNTTTTLDLSPGMGAGTPVTSSMDDSDIPVWPNPDGPSLEEVDPPNEINNTNPDLLRDGSGTPFQVYSDQSQLRNRVYVIGGGSSLITRVLAGDRQIRIADVTVFPAMGGRIYSGGQRLTYTTVTRSVTGGLLTLSAPITADIDQGSSVCLFYQADDLASQQDRAKAELDANGVPTDGVHEYTIVDGSLTTMFQLYMRAYAELELFAWPIVTIRYSTRDPKTKSGKTVSVDLTNPPCVGDFLIQDVTIDQIHDESDQLAPRYTVSASSVKFDLNDLLLSIAAFNQSMSLGGLAITAIDTTSGVAEVVRRPYAMMFNTAGGSNQAVGAVVNQTGTVSTVNEGGTTWRRSNGSITGTAGQSFQAWAYWEEQPYFEIEIRGDDTFLTTLRYFIGWDSIIIPQGPEDIGTQSNHHGVMLRYSTGSGDPGWMVHVFSNTAGVGASSTTAFTPNVPYTLGSVYQMKFEYVSNQIGRVTILNKTTGFSGTMLFNVPPNMLGKNLLPQAQMTLLSTDRDIDVRYMYTERN